MASLRDAIGRTTQTCRARNETKMTKEGGRIRPSRRKRWSAHLAGSTVLVASFLIFNAPAPAQGIPTTPRSLSFAPSMREQSKLAQLQVSSKEEQRKNGDSWEMGEDDDTFGRIIGLRGDRPWGDVVSSLDSSEQLHWTRQASQPPTRTTLQRRTNKRDEATPSTTYKVSIASFTSSLANAWNPGSRSVWFQRKAVIITSIFLAIFIVLIIGCVVFLRGKRDDDVDEEYDVSDEAALARMREERDMRLASRSEKKARRKKRKGDSSSSSLRGDNGGNSTAIVAPKWARLPTRRIRIRKARSKDTHDVGVVDSPNQGASEHTTLERRSSASLSASARAENQSDAVNTLQDQAQPTTNADATHNQDFSATAAVRTSEQSSAREEQATTDSSISDTSRSPDTSRRANRLTAADLVFAEDEEAQMDLSDALPPAYIPNQQRRSVDLSVVHPSAHRRLAGQEAEALADARDDEKRGAGQMDEVTEHAEPSSPPHGSASAGRSQGTIAPSSSVGYDGHVATDDKSALAQLRGLASQPEAIPTYVHAPHPDTGAPPASQLRSTSLATAPDLAEDDVIAQAGSTDARSDREDAGKGKHVNTSISSRLPAPPVPHEQIAFSHFDLPYVDDLTRRSTSANVAASEKTREAAAEEERAMALLASRPEDMRTLPRYEGGVEGAGAGAGVGGAVPSAPPAIDEEAHPVGDAPSVPPLDTADGVLHDERSPTIDNAPSAPPL